MRMNRHHNDTDKYPTIRLPIVESKRKKTTKREIALLIASIILAWLIIILFCLVLFGMYAGWIGV